MPTRIVIVGGGFSGALAARKITQYHLPGIDVLLIDSTDHFLFTPRLIDALASPRSGTERWSAPLAELAKRFGYTFLHGKVEHVNREQKTLTVYTEDMGTRTVPYDELILSPGAKTNYYRIPGAAEHTQSLKTYEDVIHIHQRTESLLRHAQQMEKPEEKRRLLSFIVVGGGPSGIEGLFALHTYIADWCEKNEPSLFGFTSFSLIQAGPQILPGFPLAIVHQTVTEIQRHKMKFFVGEAVTQITEESLTTSLKHTLPASLIIWAAGIEPNVIAVQPETHRDPMGYLIVDRFLQIEPHIFAAGDTILYREQNHVIPRNAQTAILMGRALARNILNLRQHRPLQPFHYHSKGNILVVGKTGFIDLKILTIKTRFAPLIRDLFYRFRFWEITGKR